jgi:hypothetical protein
MTTTTTPPDGPGSSDDEDPEWEVRARDPYSRDALPRLTDTEDEPLLGAELLALDAICQDTSRLYAKELRTLAPFWKDRDCDGGPDMIGEVEDVQVAVVERVDQDTAYRMIRDGHIATTQMPHMMARLESGELRASWMRDILRRTRPLTDDERHELDAQAATWDPGISHSTFTAHLRQAVASLIAARGEDPAQRAAARRQVRVEPSHEDDGLATLSMTGPAPDILAFGRRLDDAARAVQHAQRHALADGTPIPLDGAGEALLAGRPLTRAQLQFDLVLNSTFDTDRVDVPAPRFRLNVTIPAMTLMGRSDAPGILEGLMPIPADMARMLAADCPDWYRVLTDPADGVFLPLAADRYVPTRAMREHLRLRNPRCAVPGCEKSTVSGGEIDHIVEYDHEHPERGGQTEIANTHILCTRHHQLKTAGLIDPERIEDPGGEYGPAGDEGPPSGTDPPDPPTRPGTHPGRTRWDLGGDARVIADDDRDLIGPGMAIALRRAWDQYIRATTPCTRSGTAAEEGDAVPTDGQEAVPDEPSATPPEDPPPF